MQQPTPIVSPMSDESGSPLPPCMLPAITATAEEVLSALRGAHAQLTRLTTLVNAIYADIFSGQTLNIELLSYLAGELSLELGCNLDQQIETLQAQLMALDAQACRPNTST